MKNLRRLLHFFMIAGSLVTPLAVSAGNHFPENPKESPEALPGQTYVGLSIAHGTSRGTLIDQDGFANWGVPGWTVKYRGSDHLAGFLVGKRFPDADPPVRIELDLSVGSIRASSDLLDPTPRGGDETVRSRFTLVSSLRVGLQISIGSTDVFLTAGPAVAYIENSVTDIDFSSEFPLGVFDPDDSFRDHSADLGYAVGAGFETPFLADSFLRFDVSYYNFGEDTHRVNHSGGNRCGPGGPNRPCNYEIEHELVASRIALVFRFGRQRPSGSS